jgi:hypothetical protein
MPIRFTPSQWQARTRTAEAWWQGRLDRPLVPLWVHWPERGRAATPFRPWTCGYGAEIAADAVVDAWEAHLGSFDFLADAFPYVFSNFGPGVLAAFLGARAEFDGTTVWFLPEQERELADLHLRIDWQHPWLERIASLTRAATARWQGQAVVSFTDLGGSLDILSTFRPGERLLLDLYDCPEQVRRVLWQAHEAWWGCYDYFDRLAQPQAGTTSWAGIYSPGRTYMLQCDFAYMISPAMFDGFVKPELAATCRKLDHSFYHLDGIGQLPHLDSLLDIPELHGIQWVPGEGQKPAHEWPEVYARILRAGKLAQFIGGDLQGFRRLVEQLGTAKGFVLSTQTIAPAQLDETAGLLEQLGVPL